jgi:hypothetical protein
MITLKIREKGHFIEMPGIPSFRTPANIDISKGDIRTIVGYLKVCDITDYEIVASNKDGREVYNAKDFDIIQTKVEKRVVNKLPDKKLIKRMDRMEKMIKKLCDISSNDSTKKIEQNINGLDSFREEMLKAIKDINIKNVSDESIMDELKDEEVAPFIPDIDIEGMKLRGQGEHKTIKKDNSNTDDAADALSKILNK